MAKGFGSGGRIGVIRNAREGGARIRIKPFAYGGKKGWLLTGTDQFGRKLDMFGPASFLTRSLKNSRTIT